ncbi:MAG: sarcosine oxidase subunit gamma [Alphaproteobacteria bacterium]|nr:MAG: sarcosine oxidase subunit gamma [Alphaproteobacteria bacterium]
MTAGDQAATAGGLRITEAAPGARFSLRLRPEHLPAAEAALGHPLPRRIGEITAGQGWRALMLGPDEWLLDRPAGGPPALPGAPAHALVDISDRELILRVEGPAAAELLSIGIPRDLRGLAPGQGCRTVFDSVPVILVREGETAFTLAVWRSFAPHVAGLLEIGRREIAAGL